MSTLDPTAILISDRQRSDLGDVSDLEASIRRNGLIHPIIVRQEGDQTYLVSGNRRLQACKNLSKPLQIGVDVRFWNDLTPREAQIIELEENIKRADLPWRDHVRAIAKIHTILCEADPSWTVEKTAVEISYNVFNAYKIMTVYKNLDSPALADATGWTQAYSVLQTIAERRTAAFVHEISNVGKDVFSPAVMLHEGHEAGLLNSAAESTEVGGAAATQPAEPARPAPPTNPIIQADFIAWASTYSGPKFNLIHCDFPYDTDYSKYAKSVTSQTGEDYSHVGFAPLLTALLEHLDKIASYQSHIMVWFSMNMYADLKRRLEEFGLSVDPYPLVWHKSDNAGIIPATGGLYTRRVYETALLCSRGKRPLIKSLANVYAAPTPPNPIHPSQKSEPMLRHFFGMLIDETTDVLDPTCGSGAAIRAADSLGARSVLGLELNPTYFEAARGATATAQALRRMTK